MAALPTDVLHSIIAVLVAAVLVLSGLWIRAHDTHRAWTIERINSHEKTLAVLESEFVGVRDDLTDIKVAIREHTARDELIHDAMIRKFDLKLGTKE